MTGLADDRAAAIEGSPLAKGQKNLAAYLATETDLSVEAALQIMSISARNLRPMLVPPVDGKVFTR
ncbi:hypothetical protein [Bradyrhizobium stylosanthis]|uniref:hypothetical protein n=1 Tax=Bradyrhizobium stylosanthis TaxID=1803665 RepID=UPI0007C4D895|nr:hypothetical protein [Bradyrhizobium stylosanthis]